jgi:hypothetical protein
MKSPKTVKKEQMRINTPKTTEASNKDGDTKGQRRQPVFAMLEPNK